MYNVYLYFLLFPIFGFESRNWVLIALFPGHCLLVAHVSLVIQSNFNSNVVLMI